MKKIAIIEPIGGHGGNDIYDFNLIHSINRQPECNAVLYTCNETQVVGLDDVELTYKNVFGKSNKFIRAFNYFRGTITSLINAKKRKTSIVHLHFFGFNLLEYFNLYAAKKLFGFHVVGTAHDIESFEKYARGDASRHDYEKFFALFDEVVVHTEYARRELINHISNDVFDADKIRTIYACDLDYDNLDSNFIEKSVAREYLKLPKERKIILFFGQIKKVKGLDLLLKAFGKVVKQDPNLLLVIAGKVWKDDYSEYAKIIEEHRLEKFVDQRISFIDNKDVSFYFNAADIIVLPYRKIYNSGVLIRAMSFGTPVVASNFGPFEEFIKDGENGYLFEAENTDNLAKKLEVALNDQNKLDKVSIEEKTFIKKNFALEEIGKQYCKLYRSILEEVK